MVGYSLFDRLEFRRENGRVRVSYRVLYHTQYPGRVYQQATGNRKNYPYCRL
jgi:hypothetical protein